VNDEKSIVQARKIDLVCRYSHQHQQSNLIQLISSIRQIEMFKLAGLKLALAVTTFSAQKVRESAQREIDIHRTLWG